MSCNCKNSDKVLISRIYDNIKEIRADKKKIAALIYARNCGIKDDLDFSECNFNDKEEFLMIYMKNNIIVNSSQLVDTWASILNWEYSGDHCNSLLTGNEIDKFIENNIKYINTLKIFINSILPTYIHSMKDIYGYNIFSDISSIEYNYSDDIAIDNIMNILCIHDYLIMNIIGSTDIEFFYNISNPSEYRKIVYYAKRLEIFDNLLSFVGNLIPIKRSC